MMTNKQILSKLNHYYDSKRRKHQAERDSRLAKASLDSTFAELYSTKRGLECEISRRKAYKLEYAQLQQKLTAVTAKYDQYVESKGYDLDLHYDCPICKDTGMVDGKVCSCFEQSYIQLLQQNSTISPLPKFSFDQNKLSEYGKNPQMQKWYKVALKWCKKFDTTPIRSIYLSGSVGIGKTTLLSCIANELLENGKSVIYISAFDFSRIIHAKHFGEKNAITELYSSLFECDLLIIDDLGTEPIYKNISLEYFLSIVDWRLSHHKAIILSTNLTPSQFIEKYGERAFSRICNKSTSLSDYIKGEDLRKLTNN